MVYYLGNFGSDFWDRLLLQKERWGICPIALVVGLLPGKLEPLAPRSANGKKTTNRQPDDNHGDRSSRHPVNDVKNMQMLKIHTYHFNGVEYATIVKSKIFDYLIT